MPVPLSDFPEGRPKPKPLRRALTPWQKRVLAVLARARGPMNRNMIRDTCVRYGFATQWVTGVIQALGPSDPAKRAAFDRKHGKPSLLSLGYVEEREYDVDGVSELGVKITELGRAALEQVEDDLRKAGLEPILPESCVEVTEDYSDAPPVRGVHG
jgi:hypothetical protein